jgi:hypothetical protein
VSAVRVIMDIEPADPGVRGLVASGSEGAVRFSGWLELMQTVERLLHEDQPSGEDGRE